MGLAGRKTEDKNENNVVNMKKFLENKKVYDKRYFDLRRNELKEIFNSVKSDLQELADYFCPNTVRFISRNVNKPKVKNTKIVDSTPIIALRNFSSGFMTGATSPTRRWFKTIVLNKEVKDDYDVKDWCAKQADLTRQILYSSNFYQIIPEVYKQLGVFGFSAVSMESDYENVANFILLPIGSYFYSKNRKSEVDTFCRNYMQSAKNLVDEFGFENCSDDVKEAFDKQPDKMFELVHFVEPNKEYVKGSKFSAQKKFISVYYEVTSDKFLRKSGYDKFPFVVFEASCNGEDNYPARGLGADALPDVKQLMTMTKQYAIAVKKIVSPPMKGPAGLKNKGLADTPSAYNELDENGNGISSIYDVNPRILELKQEKDELKQTIKEHFYNDLFAMILNTAERGRTATEVNELKEEKMVLLSPLLEQIHTALRQILDWLFYEEERIGILPEIPETLEGKEIQTEFVSTLAQAMKVQNIASMERFTTFVANIANSLDPIMVKKVNAQKVIDDYADFANIDPSQIIPNEQIEEYRMAMEQKQAQQEQMAAIQQGSQMIKNMGGVDAFGGELMARLGQ